MMRNFLKNTFGDTTILESRRQLEEILDTSEDHLLNQYKKYLTYIAKVKSGLIRAGNQLIREKRRLISGLNA